MQQQIFTDIEYSRRKNMVFENEENLLPGAVSMSQFIDTVKAL